MADPVAYNPNLHVRQEGVLPQFTQVHQGQNMGRQNFERSRQMEPVDIDAESQNEYQERMAQKNEYMLDLPNPWDKGSLAAQMNNFTLQKQRQKEMADIGNKSDSTYSVVEEMYDEINKFD